MREYLVPAISAVDDKESLSDAVYDNVEHHPDVVSFRRKVSGSWVDVTAADFA